MVSFCRRYKCFESYFYWHPENPSETILDQIQNIVDQDVMNIPKFFQSRVFYKVIGSSVFMVVVGDLVAKDLITVLIVESDCSDIQEDTPSDVGANPQAVVNITSSFFSQHGSIWIDVAPSRRVRKVIPAPLENIRYLFATKGSVDVTPNVDQERIQLQHNIAQLFCVSMAKAVYYSFLRGITVLNVEFHQSIIQLKPKDICVDATNLFYVYQILSLEKSLDLKRKIQIGFINILNESFSSTNLLLDEIDTANYYYFKTQRESIEEMINLSNRPLFLTCFISSDSELSSCGDGIPEKVFDRKKVFNKQFPPTKSEEQFQFIFRLYGIMSEPNVLRLGGEQQNFVDSLETKFGILIQDIVLQSLLEMEDMRISSQAINYVESVLTSRHENDVPIEFENLIDGSILLGNSVRIEWSPEFLGPLCTKYFWKDIARFELGGLSFRRSANRYYIGNVGDSNFAKPYWILIQPASEKVLIDFFSLNGESDQRSSILIECLKVMHQCEHRANQRFLLTELADTHLARDEPPKVARDGVIQRNDNVLHDFACVQQYVKFFPVYDRLRPIQALNSILATLQAITVSNRKGILIYSDRFYINIETKGDEEENTIRPASLEKGLEIIVFGIDQAGDDITSEFIKMIGLKIDNLMQNVLGTFLARNPTAKLSISDLEFIMPVGPVCCPDVHVTYLLVPELENPHLFIVLLRQAFILFLKTLSGNDLIETLGEFYRSYYNQILSTNREKY
jgi:hypothetical protein